MVSMLKKYFASVPKKIVMVVLYFYFLFVSYVDVIRGIPVMYKTLYI